MKRNLNFILPKLRLLMTYLSRIETAHNTSWSTIPGIFYNLDHTEIYIC